MTSQLDWAIARIAELEARLKQSSSNSSKPPSSDARAPKSLRGCSGRRNGRPSGQDGVTLAQACNPDDVVRHVAGGVRRLRGTVWPMPPSGVARRQVFLLRSAVALGAQATAARAGKLQAKHHALSSGYDRREDYLRQTPHAPGSAARPSSSGQPNFGSPQHPRR